MLYLLAIGFVLSCEYVAETPCSQLLLIESAMYVYAQDHFTSYQQRNAMSLHNILLAVQCNVLILTTHPSLMYCILVCIMYLMVW